MLNNHLGLIKFGFETDPHFFRQDKMRLAPLEGFGRVCLNEYSQNTKTTDLFINLV